MISNDWFARRALCRSSSCILQPGAHLAVPDGGRRREWAAHLRLGAPTGGRESRRLARTGRLIARRALSDPTQIAYFLSNAPAETPLLTPVQVAATRYTVEQCMEEAKGEAGRMARRPQMAAR